MINLEILKKGVIDLKNLLKFMQENTFKNIYSDNFNVKKYWRNIDKQILAGFTLLFILGIFFSFSSTSILADERLDREYYSFFQKVIKHLFTNKAAFKSNKVPN